MMDDRLRRERNGWIALALAVFAVILGIMAK
jgi:hypothetical protein